MKLPNLLVVTLAVLFAAACGSDSTTPVDNTEDSATPSNGLTAMPMGPVVDCSAFPGSVACGTSCVYLDEHLQHCGRCDNPCQAGAQCVNGECTGCAAGTLDCNGTCIDVNSDVNNCGMCGRSCDAGVLCSGGVCSCPVAGQTSCAAAGCVDLNASANHCGSCNNACSTGANCLGGSCMCQGGLQQCDGVCVETSDFANCGGCGMACVAGQVCDNSACTTGCSAGRTDCSGTCVDTNTSPLNCGLCGNQCPAGQSCQNGSCACSDANQLSCGGVCTDVSSDPLNCGDCGMMCPGGQQCAAGVCSCPVAGQQACDGACVDVQTSGAHCGGCGNPCAAGQQCVGGTCMGAGCGADQEMCNGSCVPAGSCTSNGGNGNVPNPTGGAGGGPTGDCQPAAGTIVDFENGAELYEMEGRIGIMEQFNDESGTQTTTIEQEGTDACNQNVLHTQGSGFSVWGAGIGTVFTGTWDAVNEEYAPEPYDASQYTAISFRARQGSGQANPVRVNISVPSTEGMPYGNNTCEDSPDVDNPCWNHVGHFLIDDEQLTNQWQTFTFCFDRDLYPMFLPSHLTVAERNSISSQLLKIQFQFNQSFNADTAEQVPLTGGFDFYLDDLRFTNPASCDQGVFQSSAGSADAFGTNAAIGSCSPVPNAAKFNKAISQAYLRWKQRFVRSDGGVVDPQEGDRVVSEAIGYGMLITAAMGDKAAFDSIWGWASSRIGNPPNSLLGWQNGSGGSATDGDTDMAFALLMAAKQWGGNYAAAGNALAQLALQQDVVGGVVTAGNQFTNAFNPSYFSPGFYRDFSGWDSAITTTYGVVTSCANNFGGLVPDWCQTNGTPVGAATFGAQQQAGEVCPSSSPCLAFESARTPWRLGYDVCLNSQGSSVLQGFMSALKSGDSGLANGARIDTIVAGWDQSGPLAAGVGNAMAFIGPLGVAGQALGDTDMRDRAFRATLDIMERPEFYNTYYQTTVGMMALLTMSGNWPVP